MRPDTQRRHSLFADVYMSSNPLRPILGPGRYPRPHGDTGVSRQEPTGIVIPPFP